LTPKRETLDTEGQTGFSLHGMGGVVVLEKAD
jgi:hypothetical protein